MFRCQPYWSLCKPKVVALMLICVAVGMVLAPSGPWYAYLGGMLGIGLSAASGAALNHWLDERYDRLMARTQRRPLPKGELSQAQALGFALLLAVVGLGVMVWLTNVTAVLLTGAALLGYGVVYTAYLKHQSPQNIVIGGLSGAMPPLLGWVAITGHLAAEPLLLVLLIFVWTPAHFWALAIYRHQDYAKASIPMMPVTHGLAFTRHQVVLYTVLTCVASWLPFAVGMLSWRYVVVATLLDIQLSRHAWRLYRRTEPQVAMRMFRYSNVYLMLLFVAMLVDHGLTHVLSVG